VCVYQYWSTGVQIGSKCSELYCLEHSIQLDGQMPFANTLWWLEMSSLTHPLIRLVQENISRAVFVDLVPMVFGTYTESDYS
jgi:tubulin alpha